MRYAHWSNLGRLGIVLLIILLFIIFNLIILFVYLNNYENRTFLPRQSLHDNLAGLDVSKIDEADLSKRVQELLNIRVSVLEELSRLERNRTLTIKLVTESNNELERLKSQIAKRSAELERLQLHIKQALVAEKEAKDQLDLMIEPPLNLVPNRSQHQSPSSSPSWPSLASDRTCQMYNCFDYSRCSLFSRFNVYSYNLDRQQPQYNRLSVHTIIADALKMWSNEHITTDPNRACLYLLIIPQHFTLLNSIQQFLTNLSYWAGDGRNHVIINLSSIKLPPTKALVAQTDFHHHDYRSQFDLTLPCLEHIHNISLHLHRPNFSPARRKYFLSYLGHLGSNQSLIKTTLLNLASKHTKALNEFLFDLECDEKTLSLCDNQTIILRHSTFSFILPSTNTNKIVFDTQLSVRLVNCLVSGSIPVIVGGDQIVLPLQEAIDWSRAVIRLPLARLPEIYLALKTFTDADIIEMRRFGTFIIDNYYSSIHNVLKTLLAFVRNVRLQIPSPSASSESSEYYVGMQTSNSSSKLVETAKSMFDADSLAAREDKEILGPMEPAFSSIVYRRNLSLALRSSYSLWNEMSLSPFYTFPSLPCDPVLPSESKFLGSSFGFRPINEGLGGSGREFSEAIGGNHIREQFTIIILTYEREKILLEAIERFKDLPYLNKVIVVWNSPRPPSPDIQWPDIDVDIVVIKAKKNSLNNRFLPFDEIKTDAILSIDDDANLRHDEIIFAFRVWREARDRIVGFPARYHSWDGHNKNWFYNSNYTCEFSMILTGAAFFHKHYSYLYSYMMPASIREKVDDYMNCEDIAMNFLVSHVTRKPPIKTTSRWTFRCNDCSSSLSEDTTHFTERHTCLNYFAQVYGYMPLLYTQFRADSVLFKNRIPHDKQKCFRYI